MKVRLQEENLFFLRRSFLCEVLKQDLVISTRAMIDNRTGLKLEEN